MKLEVPTTQYNLLSRGVLSPKNKNPKNFQLTMSSEIS